MALSPPWTCVIRTDNTASQCQYLRSNNHLILSAEDGSLYRPSRPGPYQRLINNLHHYVPNPSNGMTCMDPVSADDFGRPCNSQTSSETSTEYSSDIRMVPNRSALHPRPSLHGSNATDPRISPSYVLIANGIPTAQGSATAPSCLLILPRTECSSNGALIFGSVRTHH